ncbi:hypothetical protein RHMOL_Rhmol13G0012000 [Rhododendron molle]|uniref:Uncharacterized protein n=1 Tax=Rhododendron molle TaxID=49168 RepID=A0ACC0L2P2_RHOML|nr:hypothetical protein RHMOL_Rhmol13G0012000 [Rhododendron molle]
MGLLKRFEVNALFFVGLALLLSCGAKGARRGLVNNVPAVFDVTKFGAIADGETECAQAFIQTFNAACASTGPSTVLIPPGTYLSGEVFFQGPCSSSPITVEMQGTIMAQTDLTLYSNGVWFTVENFDGLVMRGGGTFNGQGEQAWPKDSCGNKATCNNNLAPSLVFQNMNNSLLQDINLVNSKGFHMKIGHCNSFTACNLNIVAPGESPNTDGIHISESDHVTITDSTIGTGDDCISIGEGSSNINISRITCGPGHGISVGSLGLRPNEGDVTGIVVTNCTLTNTTNGARIKTWHNSPPTHASGIVFDDIVMNNVRNPIFIDQNYGSKQKQGSSSVKISDVHFRNIRGTTITNQAVSLQCSTTVPCEGIELVDINLTYIGITSPKIALPFSASCANAKAAFLGKQSPAACVL